jgi:hypothetical protein
MRVGPFDLRPGHKGQPYYKEDTVRQRSEESSTICACAHPTGFFTSFRMTDGWKFTVCGHV